MESQEKKNLTSNGHVSCQHSLEWDSLVFTWMNRAKLTSLSLGENSQHLSVGNPRGLSRKWFVTLCWYSAAHSLVDHWNAVPLDEIFSFPSAMVVPELLLQGPFSIEPSEFYCFFLSCFL